MTDDEARDRLLTCVIDDLVRRPGIEITPQTPLVSSGLIDSFALIDLLLMLETLLGVRIPAARVQPRDMDTVERMLDMARRLGKPRS